MLASCWQLAPLAKDEAAPELELAGAPLEAPELDALTCPPDVTLAVEWLDVDVVELDPPHAATSPATASVAREAFVTLIGYPLLLLDDEPVLTARRPRGA